MSYICFITNRNLVNSDEEYFNVIEDSIKAGVDHIILREKELDYKVVLGYARKIREMIGDKNTKLFINSMYEMRNEIDDIGVHLPFKMFLKLRDNIDGEIGVSVHSLEEAKIADKLGAAYILCSNIYETDCKKGLKGKGLSFVKEIKEITTTKVIALGGINEVNYREVLDSGADGVAIMSGIMNSDDAYKTVKYFKII